MEDPGSNHDLVALTDAMFEAAEASPSYDRETMTLIAVVADEEELGIHTRAAHPNEAIKLLLKAAQTIAEDSGVGELTIVPAMTLGDGDDDVAQSLLSVLKAAMLRNRLGGLRDQFDD